MRAGRRLAESGRRALLVEAAPDTPPGAVPATVLDSYPGVAYFDPRLHWQALRVTLGSGNAKREPRRYEQARLMGGRSSINGMFALRGLAADYDEWARLDEWVCAMAYGGWHASGTCRMGASGDPGAVVDEACRVRGLRGLRVVDASVMPSIPRANTNLPTIMVAEKISAAILAEDVPAE